MNSQNELTVAVLDYLKPQETEACLLSIRDNLLVPHTTVLLDNGGASNYAWDLYKQGLCDTLISKRESLGGGVGQTDLFRWVDTKYTLFVQQDQVLETPINEALFEYMKARLSQGACRCIDLNGDQSNRGVWTDRAHLMETDFFNSLAPFPNGGPGPLHHLRWNENYLQEVFARPENQILHLGRYFRDAGVWTVRTQPDGSRVRMRTDTKQVWWETTPTEKFVFPDMDAEEWQLAFEGKWMGGTVPKAYQPHSFNCWGDVRP